MGLGVVPGSRSGRGVRHKVNSLVIIRDVMSRRLEMGSEIGCTANSGEDMDAP
jgi:hypothetical protein